MKTCIIDDKQLLLHLFKSSGPDVDRNRLFLKALQRKTQMDKSTGVEFLITDAMLLETVRDGMTNTQRVGFFVISFDNRRLLSDARLGRGTLAVLGMGIK